ncbi:monocarboxylate transporter 12 [Phlebotomus argentipes]|uniref:monocarboxylate transporter 12 n=1 Tax=Phlebotomus argentipes TaxID=94469 RepID=UPI002892BB22|nr:monocarboxylate transporter 12 [Phlebotomus argentipes]
MTHGPAAPRRDATDGGEEEAQLPAPPDGGWGWMVAFASFAIHIVTDGMTYSFGMFYVEFLTYFGEDKSYTAWIVSILVGVTLCSGPISSSFVNRYGCRAVTIAGSLLAGISLIASVFAQNVLTLIITVGLGCGMGFGLIYLPAIVSVTMYFEKYRSLATGIAVCGSGLGTFIFAPLTESLIGNYGWRGAMLIISGIVLNCMIFGAMFRPLEAPKKKKRKSTDEETPLKNLASSSKQGGSTSSNRLRLVSDNRLPLPEDNESPIQRSVSIGQEITQDTVTRRDPNGNVENGIRQTSSQPLLTSSAADASLRASNRSIGSGTMYRPDILYQGSLLNIPQYRSRGELTITESDRYGSLRREATPAAQETPEEFTLCGCVPCSKETRDTFREMLNFSIMRDAVFILFVVSNFCTSIGFYVPYVFLAPQGEEQGLTKEETSYLLAIIGVANTVGRIILGYFSDKPWVNRLLVYNLCLTICGVATALSIFCLDFFWLSVYSVVFGFTIGAYVGLTSVILVDLLGLTKLTNAFGLLLLFQGIASLVGPPLAGWLYDVTQTYTPAFLMAGVTIAVSGLILFGIPPLQRYLRKRRSSCFNSGTL